MSKLLGILFFLTSLSSLQAQVYTNKNYAFINGWYFDGHGFSKKTIYTIDEKISFEKPSKIDSTIDLTDKFIIPPFGEAHNHNVEWYGEDRFNKLRDRYLKEGIYYVKNPNNLPIAPSQLKGRINIPHSIDASFSNGSFTAPGGHPLGLVKRNLEREIWKQEDAEGGFYYSIDNLTDFNTKWEILKKTKPDFIKTYLLYSEEFNKRRYDTTYFAWKGLNPTLLPKMVAKMHKDGYRVTAHVETAADFHTALMAKINEINHIPGFRANEKYGYQNFRITEADAKLAAKNNVVVVTTLGTAIDNLFKSLDSIPNRKQEKDMIIHNLSVLKKYNVRLAIGSDAYGQTSRYEINNLIRLSIFDNLYLLKLWCEITAQTIFPNRKIGFLNEGFEASFLVLAGNPLVDFSNTEKIVWRIKQGKILPHL
jgi:imidazolonepropionase-like amidohydrolase